MANASSRHFGDSGQERPSRASVLTAINAERIADGDLPPVRVEAQHSPPHETSAGQHHGPNYRQPLARINKGSG